MSVFTPIVKSGMVFLAFCIAFLFTTAFCDWVCKHNGYYEDAAQMATVMED
jgi:hypothetical protein